MFLLSFSEYAKRVAITLCKFYSLILKIEGYSSKVLTTPFSSRSKEMGWERLTADKKKMAAARTRVTKSLYQVMLLLPFAFKILGIRKLCFSHISRYIFSLGWEVLTPELILPNWSTSNKTRPRVYRAVWDEQWGMNIVNIVKVPTVMLAYLGHGHGLKKKKRRKASNYTKLIISSYLNNLLIWLYTFEIYFIPVGFSAASCLHFWVFCTFWNSEKCNLARVFVSPCRLMADSHVN